MKKIAGILLLIVGIPLFLLFGLMAVITPFTEAGGIGVALVALFFAGVIAGATFVPAFFLLRAAVAEDKAAQALLASELPLADRIRSFRESNPDLQAKMLRRIGSSIYAKLLAGHVEDLEISEEEKSELALVEQELQLTADDVARVKRRFARPTVQKLSAEALSDHVLEADEREKIYELADFLGLNRTAVDQVLKTQALAIFKDYRDAAAADRRLSPEEERELDSVMGNLGLQSADLQKRDQDELAYFKLLWEVDNGILPEIPAPIILQKNEVCHLAVPADRLESKTVTVGRTGGSRGVSVRIAKGVTYRVGAARSQPIKAEVTQRHPGTLCITNKRVVFQAAKKGVVAPIRSIVSMNAFSDGVEFQKGATTYLFQFKRAELVPMILTAVVNRQ